MTDVILGIDFQREYRISYDWDEDKQCYIRYKGHFLCYTEDMESGINQVSVAKTIRIPPKHNGAISVSIKGHDIKNPTACFIGSQYTDTDMKLIDGVHDILRNATLQVLVINNSNHHVNFPKGMKIGHLEPLIDDLTQIPINSATTQRMLPRDCKTRFFYTTEVPARTNNTTTVRLPAKDLQGLVCEGQNDHRYNAIYTDVHRHGRLRSRFSETLPSCNETLPMGKRGNMTNC